MFYDWIGTTFYTVEGLLILDYEFLDILDSEYKLLEFDFFKREGVFTAFGDFVYKSPS